MFRRTLLLTCLMMVVFGGCLMPPVDLVQRGTLSLEIQGTEGLTFQRVTVEPVDRGILIKGYVKGGRTARFKGCQLYASLLSAEGEVLAETSSKPDMLAKKRQHGHSPLIQFCIPLHTTAPEGAVLQLGFQ